MNSPPVIWLLVLVFAGKHEPLVITQQFPTEKACLLAGKAINKAVPSIKEVGICVKVSGEDDK